MSTRGRFVAAAAVLAVTAVALAGCAPAAGSAQPGTHQTPQPSASATPAASMATATPSGTPSADPANAPSDPGSWIIDFGSMGGVRVGEPIAPFAGEAALQPVEDTVDCPAGFTNAGGIFGSTTDSVGLSFLDVPTRGTGSPDPVLTLGSATTATPPDAVLEDTPATEAGIRLGATEEALRAAYPDLQTGHSKYDEPGGSATYFLGPVDGRYLVFQVAPTASGARTVEHIATSDRPSIIDYCD